MFDPIFSTIMQRPFYHRHQLLDMTGISEEEFAAMRFPRRSHPEAFIFTATEFTEILALNSDCDPAIQDCLDFFAAAFTKTWQPPAPRIFFTKEETDRIFYGLPVNTRSLKTLNTPRPLYYPSTVHLCLYAAMIASVPYRRFARLYDSIFSKIFSLGMFSFFIEWISGLDLILDIAEAGNFTDFSSRSAGFSNIQRLLLDELEPAHA